jgi:AraC-like DNA-binding protein
MNEMYAMMKYLYYLIFFMFFSFPVLGQTTRDVHHDIDRKISENQILLEKDPEQALLKIVKLKEEAIEAKYPEGAIKCINQLVTILLLNKGDYKQVIEELKLGEKLSKESTDYIAMIHFCIHRSGVYFQIGLPDLAYQALQEALLLTDELADGDQKNIELAVIYCNISIYYHFKEDNKNILLYTDKGLASLSKVNDNSGRIGQKIGIQAVLYHGRASLHLTQHQVDSAKYYYVKAYDLFASEKYVGSLFPKLDLLKSMCAFFYQQQDYQSAIHYAQVGLKLGGPKASINEHLFYDFLQKSYLQINQVDSAKFYSDLAAKSKDKTNTAIGSGLSTTFEERSEQHKTNYRDQVQKIIFLGLGVLLVLSIGTVYVVRRSRQHIHKKYEALMTKLSNQEPAQHSPTIEDPPSVPLHPHKEGFYIPDETLVGLLKKLEKFEKSKRFIEKNVTLSSMAHDLDTNARYISEIIKEYRGKNFNNYINGLRIELVTQLLYNDPQYRKYKIAYLASYAGFSSGAVFTNIFKKETGMTPSYFINQLTKEEQ